MSGLQAQIRPEYQCVLYWPDLLHYLPGNMNTKESVISNSAPTLKADGTLYGATILGSGVTHNKFGSKLMNIYNKKGIFNNWQDSASDLRAILKTHFREVVVKVNGTVALFPRQEKFNSLLRYR